MADTRGIRAGRAFVELGVSDKLAAGLRRAQQRLEAFGESVRNIGLRLAGIGSAITAALFGATRLFASTGDDLDEMSQRTGVSVEALSELGYAADLAGGDLATLETGLKFMQRAIVEAQRGSAAATDVLRELGLTVADLAGLSPDEQFKRLADRIASIEDPAKRVAVAMRLFGRSGTQLLPLLSEGANGIEALQKRARELGLTVSTEAARDAAELSDALDTLWRVVRQGAFAIGAVLAPTFKDLAERATRIVVAATEWIKRNREVLIWALKVAAVVAAVGIVLIALGFIASIAGTGLGLLAGALTGAGAAAGVLGAIAGALLSPVGLAVAAVVALGAAILITSGAGGEALSWLMARFYTADFDSVSLAGFYKGRSAFLTLSGPSLNDVDLSLLDRRGIVTMGVNNSWTVHRPTLWTCVDDPGRFIDTGWKDPGVLKFVPTCQWNKRLRVQNPNGTMRASAFTVRQMPAVLFFRRADHFDHERFLTGDSIPWGNDSKHPDSLGITGKRSVMLVALRLLHHLGFGTVYLLGCDFKMDRDRKYAFAEHRATNAIRHNNVLYDSLSRRFEALRPHFERHKFRVVNCSPGSALDVFDRMVFADAVAKAGAECGKPVNTQGWYEPNAVEPSKAEPAREVVP